MGWKRYYWLDFVKFSNKLAGTLGGNNSIEKVKYFSAPAPTQPENARQGALFQANQVNSDFELILGAYLPKTLQCRTCNSPIQTYEEKKTDVNIAIHLLEDVMMGNCDGVVLISADSDLAPPLEAIKRMHPKFPVMVLFPPKRRSYSLQAIADSTFYLQQKRNIFNQSLLADPFLLPNGVRINKPANWV